MKDGAGARAEIRKDFGIAHLRGAAAGTDGLITCLTSPRISTEVMTGPDGALAAMAPGLAWIETSTTEVHELLRVAALARERGEITVLIGGNADVLERHRPAISAFGDPIIHMGDIGAASTLIPARMPGPRMASR